LDPVLIRRRILIHRRTTRLGVLGNKLDANLVFPEGGRGLECGEVGEKLERGLEAAAVILRHWTGAGPGLLRELLEQCARTSHCGVDVADDEVSYQG
jgi:hypothetical protein